MRLGELALNRADAGEVKDFARRMVEDHGAMQEQWDALIRQNGLPIEPGLAPAEERQVSRLERLSGRAFDREYLAAMIRDHRKNARTFQRMEPSLHSSDVRRLAASGLNTVQEHLTTAQQLERRAGADASVRPTHGERLHRLAGPLDRSR